MGAIQYHTKPRLAYTRMEAADLLGISVWTVDRLSKRGLLNPSRGSFRPLYSKKEIERFLEETAQEVAV